MDEKNKKNKIRTIICVAVLIVVVAVAVITACILHAKQNELDALNDQKNNIPQVEATELFENFS